MDKDEAELIRGVLKQDKRALAKFQKRYRKRLFNFVALKVKDPRDAEEIVQDALVGAIYCLPSFSGRSCLWSWLCAIAKHETVDFYRKKRIKTILFSHFPGLENIISQALSPELALQEKEMKEKIIRVFLSLAEGYREILRLKYIDGLSGKEIALRLGKSVKAVEMRLRRARHSFVRNWHDQKLGPQNSFTFSPRELSLVAEYLGLDRSSLPDASGHSG